MSKVSEQQAEELGWLAEQPEEAVDTSDIPEISDWADAQRGRFYRPVKQQITLRNDVSTLADDVV